MTVKTARTTKAARAVGGGSRAGRSPARTLGLSRAARELGLKPREFELAAQLRVVRTVPAGDGRRRQVHPEEVARLRATEGFPATLRERLRVVGTAEGAELMDVTPGRFTRLARTGCFSPVRFYVNRYRAVVWLYLASDVRDFAAREPGLLTGTLPHGMLSMLDADEDWRARNWRSRRIGQLLAQATDPWERAAVPAAVLDPLQIAEAVQDPGELARLCALRPTLIYPRSDSAAANEVVARVLTADIPDEILWHRASLAFMLDEARTGQDQSPSLRKSPSCTTDTMSLPSRS